MTASELRVLLAEMGMTQREAARLLGIDERTVHRYVAGFKIPTTVQLALAHIKSQRIK